ncbi:phosphatase PAP2 family protein [Actinoallomurus sp. NPDC052308]|uniref:phosphatase PAP2 family protein n=1 Tax=Actinoallomurus sp. NPDC052308 TaxID=3155530 RepID=UPI0034473AF1
MGMDTAGPRAAAWHRSRLVSGLGQAALIVLLFYAYRIGRRLAEAGPADAMRHARSVWRAERLLHLPNEASLQHAALHWDGWVRVADVYYVTVHFPATAVFLAWVWWRHREGWPRVRAAIILSTALALAGHFLYPLAPPRLLPGTGLVDLMNVYGPSAYAEAPGHGASNQFAAMPSLHVGWAILVAWGIIRYGAGRARWAAVAYPVATTSVVVLTANHYWLDGVAGAIVVIVSVALSGVGERIVSRRGAQGI